MRPSFTVQLALCSLLFLMLNGRGQAQTPAATLPAKPAFDVILRLDGEEIAGRVLLIRPTELRYVPAQSAVGHAASAAPDTLWMAASEVFLVRYANGTREVLTRPHEASAAPAPPPPLGDGRLRGLLAFERQRLGQADAERCYRGREVFWRSSAIFFLGLPGLAVMAATASRAVPPNQLRAPVPALLQDPDYRRGYQQQANRTRRGKAWAGYGTGAAIVLGALAFSVGSGQ